MNEIGLDAENIINSKHLTVIICSKHRKISGAKSAYNYIFERSSSTRLRSVSVCVCFVSSRIRNEIPLYTCKQLFIFPFPFVTDSLYFAPEKKRFGSN